MKRTNCKALKIFRLAERAAGSALAVWLAPDSNCQFAPALEPVISWSDGTNCDKVISPADNKPLEGRIWVAQYDGGGFKTIFPTLNLSGSDIWEDEARGGFHRGTQTLSLEAGATYGVTIFGGSQKHDLALASLSYGYMLSRVVAEDHWFRGNWEVRAELFGGSEFSPNDNWVAGFTPHLRYDFAIGTKWVPFVDGGAGVNGTGIGPPDLSHTFEFNLQFGGGVHRFLRPNLALTAEVKYFHMSCAGLSSPNLGLNGVTGMVGLSRFF